MSISMTVFTLVGGETVPVSASSNSSSEMVMFVSRRAAAAVTSNWVLDVVLLGLSGLISSARSSLSHSSDLGDEFLLLGTAELPSEDSDLD